METATVNEVKTGYWHKLDDGRIQCDLCPRYCKVKNGQRGLCFVRGAENDEIVLLTYGRSSGFCIDPVEKKPLNHYLPGTPVLSFGTAGCNLACKFCQNWDMSKSREMDTLADQASPEKIARVAKDTGCRAVAYTYNDPVIFMEYAIDVAKECRKLDIRSIAVTAGYICEEPRAEFFRYMDAANVDLKSFDENFYWKLTGAHLQPVLDTLLYIRHETDVWLEVTTLLIPGHNDTDEELENMCRWYMDHLGPDVPLHFSAFHPEWKMMDVAPTPMETLLKAHRIAKAAGIHYVYTGNIHDREHQSTLCSQCGKVLIGRDWYELDEWNLDEQGRCRFCQAPCAGVFEATQGTWGSRRQPVRLRDWA